MGNIRIKISTPLAQPGRDGYFSFVRLSYRAVEFDEIGESYEVWKTVFTGQFQFANLECVQAVLPRMVEDFKAQAKRLIDNAVVVY